MKKVPKKTLRAVLKLARSFVLKGFAQGHYALDDEDVEASPVMDDARKWCVVGALDRACFDLRAGRDARRAAYDTLADLLPKTVMDAGKKTKVNENLQYWNDCVTQGDVIALYDRAIEKLT